MIKLIWRLEWGDDAQKQQAKNSDKCKQQKNKQFVKLCIRIHRCSDDEFKMDYGVKYYARGKYFETRYFNLSRSA